MTAYTEIEPLEDATLDDQWMNDVSVNEYDLQTDGYLSLLAMTYDETGALSKWGMLLDQVFSDGATYNIALTQDPVELVWTTSTTTALQFLLVTAERQDVEYDLAVDFNPGLSGIKSIPIGFPADSYNVSGGVDVSTDMSLSGRIYYTSLPETVEVPIPDYSFDNVNYDANSGILNWTLSGTSPRDFINVIWAHGAIDVFTDWTVVMSPDRTNWQVMNLPYPANTWLDKFSLEASQSASIIVLDSNRESGYDESRSQGIDYETPLELVWGAYEFIDNPISDEARDAGNRAIKSANLEKRQYHNN
ncbi:MAG: hypothetical protein ABFS45_17635 [Pseudomonadota bacterium]